jgi:hypothetical protein
MEKHTRVALPKWVVVAVVVVPFAWQCFMYVSVVRAPATTTTATKTTMSTQACPPCSVEAHGNDARVGGGGFGNLNNPGVTGPVIDFFVRTWKGDGHWLIFLLRSIEAHVPRTVYRKIIVTYNRQEDAFFRSYLPLIPLPLVLIPEDDVYFQGGGPNNGSYYSQMYSKLMPWKHSDAEYFVHIDSDCVFTKRVSVSDFVDEQGRVYVAGSPFAAMKESYRVWQAPAEKLLNESVPTETMTGFPFVFPRGAYQGMIAHVEQRHGMPFLDVLKSMDYFNEFTPLGHYLMHHMPGKWVENTRKSEKVKQQRSWNGLTPEAAATCEIAIRSV